MKFDAKTLKIDSIILIILTIVNLFTLIGMVMAKEFSIETIMQMSSTTEKMALITFVISIVALCLGYLISMIMGLGGLRQANGKCNGQMNVILSIVMLVLKNISIVVCIYYLIQGKLDFEKVLLDLVYISFLISYLMCAKKV